MDKLLALRVFIAVAEEKSFAKAARRLLISPTAVTRAVAALEDELGVMLFIRTTRTVRLSDEGSQYFERCRTAVADLDDAARSVRGMHSSPRGLLVVTAPVVFGCLHIRPIISALLLEHENLDARLLFTDRVVRIVEEGVDVALRIADLSDSALHAIKVGDVRRVLVASPSYLAAHGTPQTVAALYQHAHVVFDNFAPEGEWKFAGPGRPTVKVKPKFLLNDVGATVDAVVDGAGIARLLSYQVMDELSSGRLVKVLDKFAPPPVPVHLVFPASRQRSPNVRIFLDRAREYFKNRPLS